MFELQPLHLCSIGLELYMLSHSHLTILDPQAYPNRNADGTRTIFNDIELENGSRVSHYSLAVICRNEFLKGQRFRQIAGIFRRISKNYDRVWFWIFGMPDARQRVHASHSFDAIYDLFFAFSIVMAHAVRDSTGRDGVGCWSWCLC